MSETAKVTPAWRRVWTIQPELVWRRLEREGRLRVDRRRQGASHHAYEWLLRQLPRRLPGYGGGYPWWAYGQRPDLRAVRHEKALGQLHVMIELELPVHQVLTFPAWAWDDIFYGRFLSAQRAIATEWHRRLRAAVPDEDELPQLPQPWLSELEGSWELLFKMRAAPHHSGKVRRRLGHEAVFELLALDDVRRVTFFAGTSRARAGRS